MFGKPLSTTESPIPGLVVFDLPVVAIMALVPKPSAVRKMMPTRQTCF